MKLFHKLTPYLITLFILLSITCLLGAGRPDFSTKFCAAAAAAVFVWRLLYRRAADKKWLAAVCRAGAALFAVFLVTFAAVQGLILHTQLTAAPNASELPPAVQAPASADTAQPTLIVFGAALRGDTPTQALVCRLESALDWLSTFPDGIAVLSGGLGDREHISEAEAMYRWLTGRGVDPARLILEDQSRNTEENIAFSVALLDKRGLTDPESPVTAVSNGFHLYRIDRLLSRAGVDAALLSARMPNPGLVVSMAIREYFAIGKMWLFEVI